MIRGAMVLYRIWLAAVTGYLLGSVLTSDIAMRLANRGRDEAVDLRSVGSGNPGGANAVVNLGKGWGALVVAGDMGKGTLAASAGRLIAGSAGAYAAATAVIVGACYPAFANFKGGKGLAATAGGSFIVFPGWVPVNLFLLGAGKKLTGSIATATYITATVLMLATVTWWRKGLSNLWGPPATKGLPAWGLVMWALLCYRYLTAPEHMGDRDRSQD